MTLWTLRAGGLRTQIYNSQKYFQNLLPKLHNHFHYLMKMVKNNMKP
ncbi:hypothetical protein R80B4_02844 [Fibrobacteres bacterium R8-0-B4]